MIPRFGAPPLPGQTYVRRAGAYSVLPRFDRLLITCQRADAPDFQLPGGGIDPGESPLQALHREVLEETGWRIAKARRIGAFRRFVFMPEYGIWAEKICLIYLARPTVQAGPPGEPDHTAHWMTAQRAARDLSNAGDRHFAALVRPGERQRPRYSNRVAETSSSMPWSGDIT